MNDKEKDLCDLLEEALRSSIYSNHPPYRIHAKIDDLGLSLCYRERKSAENGQVSFDIQIVGDTCYLNWLFMLQNHARNGYERALYLSLEKFCRKLKCSKISLNESDDRYNFWMALGFKKESHQSFVKEI